MFSHAASATLLALCTFTEGTRPVLSCVLLNDVMICGACAEALPLAIMYS